MRLLFVLTVALYCSFSTAEDAIREPATDSSGPTVILDTLSVPEKGFLHWELLSIGDAGRNFSGGAKTGSAVMGLSALRLHFHNEKSLGLKGNSVFIHLQSTYGRDMTEYIGDSQTTSNIEAVADTGKVYEAWMSQEFGRFSLLAGLFDLNSEFYVTEASALFLNASFGIGAEFAQTGVNGPSIFPTPGLAARSRLQIGEYGYLMAAVFEGESGSAQNPYGTKVKLNASEGELLIAETGWRAEKMAKLGLGAWTYSQEDDERGLYLLAEKHLAPADLAFFVRYGVAAYREGSAKFNLSGGAVYREILGLGWTTADAETAIELTYSVELTKWLVIQPDLQYVVNPGADPSFDNALTGYIRVKINLSK